MHRVWTLGGRGGLGCFKANSLSLRWEYIKGGFWLLEAKASLWFTPVSQSVSQSVSQLVSPLFIANLRPFDILLVSGIIGFLV